MSASRSTPFGLIAEFDIQCGGPDAPMWSLSGGTAGQSVKSVSELVALCKANPGRISFASAGGGSAQHLALEMFKLRAGIDALHVPYKGSGPLLVDLIGGQVNYCFETMTAATPHVKSGKVQALAQTRTKRAKGHPAVPTMEEQGFAGFDATTWYGLAGPGKMPAAMAQRMNFIWLKDFLDDEVAVSTDLYEVMQAFRSSRPTSA